VNDTTQYDVAWAEHPENGPDCTPIGFISVKLIAYQGGILKAQWWCYGDKGAPKAGAACNNKVTGGEVNNTLFTTGPTKGTFNDLKNAKGMNGCNVIMAAYNGAAPIAFGATVTGCKSRLSALIPALNGCAECFGEVTGGLVLSDFYLEFSNSKWLKLGPHACVNGKVTVLGREDYFKLKGETIDPDPLYNTTSYDNPC
jgi:hypothetical protein